MRKILSILAFTFAANIAFAQDRHEQVRQTGLLTDMIDTSTILGKNMLNVATKLGNISFSGYIQPQFQAIETKGAASYNGGDFAPFSNNRFRLRRGRFRMDYTNYNKEGKPSLYFVFQFDGTERGVITRDFWGRYYENRWELFHASAGIMARPFGFELLYSSSNRESPERGRMSQILMASERDLGAMLSFAPRKKDSKLKWLGVDVGLFNGQGLTGNQELDNTKDFVGKISLKKTRIGKSSLYLSGGLSMLYGGIESRSPIVYKYGNNAMLKDSAVANNAAIMPRKYYGADIQLTIPNKQGVSEFRAEYIFGQQTAASNTSATPGVYPVTNSGTNMPLYVRNFDGAYFWYLQHLGSRKHQAILKYDWYDPNTDVKGNAINAANNFTAADVRYSTLGAGYVYYYNNHLKMTFWYEHPMNESTGLTGYDKDIKDDNFTIRAQFSF